MSYSFHPAAEAEYLEAIRYYESKRPGLGAALLADFESVIDTVCAAPRRNPVEQSPDVRRKSLRRFPYTVLYRERSGLVEVLAIAHHRRRPEYWVGRL
ncbi:MAG: type II toxin-antitoxin system RelE/ParE family toxin [Thiocapsa sp.]|uniref:type II toxin-antitoxin system RelE/ParE family toxin n=1 Tax=Thiocapsa sp. TaxID=2024551 RepID=UPI001BCD25FE|nr:type II toxin-antitoxin system RelE/ParE family toxin [Thiocapsa sp.]QVL50029.1 MAG: type II toxin-antitoxin system RelE/ParE family toxin [Thiocapsa sp.]